MSSVSSDGGADEDARAGDGSAGAGGSSDKRDVVALYVLNINFRSTQNALRERFSEFGKVVGVYIPTDRGGKSKGFGFVEYATDEEAQAAIQGMNDQVWDGRPLHVELSRSPAHRERRRGFESNRSDDRDRSDRSYRSTESRSRRDRDSTRERDRGRDRHSRDDRRRRHRSDDSDSDSPPARRRRSSRRSDSD
jgi:RNA recognition motif-containing protein